MFQIHPPTRSRIAAMKGNEVGNTAPAVIHSSMSPRFVRKLDSDQTGSCGFNTKNKFTMTQYEEIGFVCFGEVLSLFVFCFMSYLH